MLQLPYRCSIAALMSIALHDKAERERLEREEQERQEEMRRKRVLSLDNILADICTVFNEKADMVKTKNRKEELVLCRKIFCYVAKMKTRYKLKQISGEIGGRDHTTAIHHIQKVAGFIDVQDPEFITHWKFYLLNSTLFNENDFK